MRYMLFFTVLGLSAIATAQQHDPQSTIDQLAQELAIKSCEFLESSWQDYKKENPDQTRTVGDCLEFDLYLINKLKSADAAYIQFESGALVAPRLTYEYAKAKYELENRKNIANLAVLLSSQLRAFIFKKNCEPKDKPLGR